MELTAVRAETQQLPTPGYMTTALAMILVPTISLRTRPARPIMSAVPASHLENVVLYKHILRFAVTTALLHTYTFLPPQYGITEHGQVSGEAEMMAEIYTRGPIACTVAVTADFEKYSGGVFNDTTGAKVAISVSCCG